MANTDYDVMVYYGSGRVKVGSMSVQENGALATFTPNDLGKSEGLVGSDWRWDPGSNIYKENPTTGNNLETTFVSPTSGNMDFTFTESGGASSLSGGLVVAP